MESILKVFFPNSATLVIGSLALFGGVERRFLFSGLEERGLLIRRRCGS